MRDFSAFGPLFQFVPMRLAGEREPQPVPRAAFPESARGSAIEKARAVCATLRVCPHDCSNAARLRISPAFAFIADLALPAARRVSSDGCPRRSGSRGRSPRRAASAASATAYRARGSAPRRANRSIGRDTRASMRRRGPSFAPGGSGSSRPRRAARRRFRAASISARRDGRAAAGARGVTAIPRCAASLSRAMTRARFRCPSLCRAFRVDELLRHHADFVFVDEFNREPYERLFRLRQRKRFIAPHIDRYVDREAHANRLPCA